MQTKNQKTATPKRFDERQIVRQVIDLAEPVCAAEGLELVFVEFQRESGGRVMRLYIDKPGGVGLDDCTAVSRQVSDLLDIYLDPDIVYNLEVSSPGSNRPLGKLADFERFQNRRIDLRFFPELPGDQGDDSGRRLRAKAILRGVRDDNIRVEINGQEMTIAHQQVIKACLVDYHGDK